MSIYKNYYIIAGYDLTKYRTDKYDDWKWTDDGEKYTCYQSKGYIQLFDDPMNGDHLYLGYILEAGDQYLFGTTKFGIEKAEVVCSDVQKELKYLQDIGIVRQETIEEYIPYEMIAFEECN